MRISSLHSGNFQRSRPASSSAPTPEPVDTVEVTPPKSDGCFRPGGWFAFLGGLFGPTSPAVLEAVELAEELSHTGVEFRRLGRRLTWKGFRPVWREAKAEIAGRWIADGKRVEAKQPGQDWVPVSEVQDLEQLRQFQSSQPRSSKAETLAQLDQAGISFLATKTDLEGQPEKVQVGAYGAYRSLTGDPTLTGLECLRQDRNHQVLEWNDVNLLAFLEEVGPADQLDQPQRARSVKGLADQGYRFSQDDFASARQSGPLPIFHRGLELTRVPSEKLNRPELLLPRVDTLRKRYERLHQDLGPRAPEAWRQVETVASDRNHQERDRAITSLYQSGARHRGQLYQQVLREARPDEDLVEVAQLAALAGDHHRQADLLFSQLRTLPQEHHERYLQVVDEVLQLEFAEQVHTLLSQGRPDQYAQRRTVWKNLLEVAQPELGLAALQALGTAAEERGEALVELMKPDPGKGLEIYNLTAKLPDFEKRMAAFHDLGDFEEATRITDCLQGRLLEDGEAFAQLRQLGDNDLDRSLQLWPKFSKPIDGELLELCRDDQDEAWLESYQALQPYPLEGPSRQLALELAQGERPTGRLHQITSLLGQDEKQNRTRLDQLAQLGQAAGSIDSALTLWPLLKPGPDQPAHHQALCKLAAATSEKACLKLFPLLLQGPVDSLDERCERAHRQAQACGKIETTEPALELQLGLLQAGVGESGTAALTELAEGSWDPAWSADNEWNRDPQGVWSQGTYRNNQNDSLTSPPLSLDGVEQTRLEFRVSHDLELNCDYCFVEVSTDGEQWNQLKRMTGHQSWAPQSLDLSPYSGQDIRFRFRFWTDGSTTDRGVFLTDIKVTGRGPEGTQTVFQDSDQASLPRLVKKALKTSQPDRALRAVVDTVSQTGPEQAHAIWDTLCHRFDQPTFEEERQGLTELATLLGAETATQAWPKLASWGSAALNTRVERALGLAEAASVLAPDQNEQSQLWYRLLGSPLTAEVGREMAQLRGTERPVSWTPQDSWGRTTIEGRSGVWADSPDGKYRDNQNSSLTSSPISLEGLEGCRLSFEARYAFEPIHDNGYLEASRDGQTWSELHRFSNQADWARHEVDLSDYDDGTVRLRFRIKSDVRHTEQGMYLHDLELSGFNSDGHRVHRLKPGFETVGLEETLTTCDLAGHNLEDKNRAAAALVQLSKAGGSFQKGVALWPGVATRFHQADFNQQVTQLSFLTSKVGVEQALKIWPQLQAGSLGLELSVRRALSLYELARLLDSFGPESQVTHLWTEMLRCDLSQQAALDLASLADQLKPMSFKAGGSWARTSDPNQGQVWADSPGRNYRSNVDASLKTVVPLQGARYCQLSFTARHVLEDRLDYVSVEARVNGQDWERLGRLEGQSEWQRHSFDLSRFDGRECELRFHFHSDGSQEYEGVSLADIRVTGERYGQSALLASDCQQIDFGELFKAADYDSESVQMLTSVVAQLKTVPAAAELFRLVPPGDQRPSQLKALTQLALRIGHEEAAALWPRIPKDPPASLDQRVEQAALAFQAARAVLGEEGSNFGLVIEIQDLLDQTPLTPSQGQTLVGLLRGAGEGLFEAEQTWALVNGLWQDSPGSTYQNNQDSSLTSRPISLDGLASPELTFRLEGRLEERHDLLRVEVQGNDGEWRQIETFSGQLPTRDHRRSLNDFEGETVRFRFRLTTDSSQVYGGVSLSAIKLDGSRQGTRRPIFDSEDRLQAARPLLKLLKESDNPGQALDAMGGLPPAQVHSIIAFKERYPRALEKVSLADCVRRVQVALVLDGDFEAALQSLLIPEDRESTLEVDVDAITIDGFALDIRD